MGPAGVAGRVREHAPPPIGRGGARGLRPAEMQATVLAFDFGAKRIGVAVGDTGLRIAHPLATIAFDDNRRRFEAIAALVAEWQPRQIVVGLPHLADGAEHPLAPAIARFVRRLQARFGLPVAIVDETLTSWEGGRELAAAGVRGRGQKAHLDAMAARAILETWFSASPAEVARP